MEDNVYTATVSTKGWVVIPKDLRQRYGLKKGSRVQVVEYDGTLALIPLADDPVTALRGMLAGGPSLTADLMAEHARDLAKENSAYG
jgi:AbrB family looped-hinge helix DNA binding protein